MKQIGGVDVYSDFGACTGTGVVPGIRQHFGILGEFYRVADLALAEEVGSLDAPTSIAAGCMRRGVECMSGAVFIDTAPRGLS